MGHDRQIMLSRGTNDGDNKDDPVFDNPKNRMNIEDYYTSSLSFSSSTSMSSSAHPFSLPSSSTERTELVVRQLESRQPFDNTDDNANVITRTNNPQLQREKRRQEHGQGQYQRQLNRSYEAISTELDCNNDGWMQYGGMAWSFVDPYRCQRVFHLVGLILFGSSLAMLSLSHHYYMIAVPSLNNNAGQNDEFVGSDETKYALRLETLKESKGSLLEGMPNAAVASDHLVCSKIGSDILSQRGGNAVDAAIATALCLGVANPASSGLGGGAFILIRSSRKQFEENKRTNTSLSGNILFDDARDRSHRESEGISQDDPNFITEVIDCRETAPEQSSRNMYTDLPRASSFWGGLAVPIPGELRGLELAHSRHGKLPWNEVVEPARLLAQDGVAVGNHLADDIEALFTKVMMYADSDKFQGILRYLSSRRSNKEKTSVNTNTTEYLREGEILRNPGLAKLLGEIAERGADAFYKGSNAENLVKDVQEAGGILTLNDMETYRAVLRTPVQADVSGYSLIGVPPPSSGGAVVIAIARFLSGYSRPFAAASGALSVHRMVEGMRHAFSIRMSLSDPTYNENVTKDAVDDLTSNGYMESLRQITNDQSTLGLSQYGGSKWAQMHDEDGTKEAKDAHEGDRRRLRRRRLARPFGYLEDNGTSHFSVVDKDGNAVAMTSSINNIFGSLVFSETTGVLLGNTMDDFGVPGQSNVYGLKPAEANFIVPGKRVRNSPTVVVVCRIICCIQTNR